MFFFKEYKSSTVISQYLFPLYLLLLTGISKLKLSFIPTLILVQLHKRSQCVQGKLLHYWVQLVIPLCRKKQSLFALHYRRNDREALQSIRPSTCRPKDVPISPFLSLAPNP